MASGETSFTRTTPRPNSSQARMSWPQAGPPQDDVVPVEHGKGLISYKLPGAADGVAQALGLLLPHIEDVGQLGDAYNLV